MSLWSNNVSQGNNAPKYKILPVSAANGQALYGNVTPSAYINNQAVGVFGANVSQASSKHGVHSGWVLVTQGTGPITSFTINSGGSGYDNADHITVSGGAVNATANVSTNATGGIVSLSNVSYGSGFKNISNSTLAITTSLGTTANITFTLGGRAGRTERETLVAMGSTTGAGNLV